MARKTNEPLENRQTCGPTILGSSEYVVYDSLHTIYKSGCIGVAVLYAAGLHSRKVSDAASSVQCALRTTQHLYALEISRLLINWIIP